MRIRAVPLFFLLLLWTTLPAKADEIINVDIDFYQLQQDAELYFKLSSALFSAFTSQPSLVQGSFTAKYDDGPDASLEIFKLPIPVYFRKEHALQPFIKLTYGYSDYNRVLAPWDLRIPFEEDFGRREKVRIKTNSVGLRTGAKWDYAQNLSIEPSLGIAYTHVHHKQYARLMITDYIIQQHPEFHRDLYDTTVELVTISPGMKHSLDYPLGPGTVGFDAQFLTQYSKAFRSKGRYGHITSTSSVTHIILDYELPLGRSLFSREVSVKPFVGRTDYFGDIREGLDIRTMYEYGVNFLMEIKDYVDFLSKLSLGGSYIKAYQLTGWKIGLGWEF
ncbi:hypothetical protein [Desulfonatronum thioautotrophicum]|uniref:hypothetical protein n=1 Tax=Desulfonatronum thioautotrophicum TaxID=617001 RepID=UPI0005EB241D|nr:hypothetical protein [Desulfonatronum thioautotrophicum]